MARALGLLLFLEAGNRGDYRLGAPANKQENKQTNNLTNKKEKVWKSMNELNGSLNGNVYLNAWNEWHQNN